MRHIHKLELARARARQSLAKVRNARPRQAAHHGRDLYDVVEIHLENAVQSLDNILKLEKSLASNEVST